MRLKAPKLVLSRAGLELLRLERLDVMFIKHILRRSREGGTQI